MVRYLIDKRFHIILVFSFCLCITVPSVFAQSPTDLLASISVNEREWVNSSCLRSFGPSLYASCVRREVTAIRGF